MNTLAYFSAASHASMNQHLCHAGGKRLPREPGSPAAAPLLCVRGAERFKPVVERQRFR